MSNPHPAEDRFEIIVRGITLPDAVRTSIQAELRRVFLSELGRVKTGGAVRAVDLPTARVVTGGGHTIGLVMD